MLKCEIQMHVSYSLPDVNRLDVAAEGALGQVGLPADLAGMQLHSSGVALRSVSRLRRCHDYHKALFNRAFKSRWVLNVAHSQHSSVTLKMF